jgi:hypothetical protein
LESDTFYENEKQAKPRQSTRRDVGREAVFEMREEKVQVLGLRGEGYMNVLLAAVISAFEMTSAQYSQNGLWF